MRYEIAMGVGRSTSLGLKMAFASKASFSYGPTADVLICF